QSFVTTPLNALPWLTVALSHFVQAWTKTLILQLTEQDWYTIFSYTFHAHTSVFLQETNYTLLSRWYNTPAKIHKCVPSQPSTCRRCGLAMCNLEHIWWSCPRITGFQIQVQEITGHKITLEPAKIIFHFTD
ncbi:Hypothetical predicted protein, partial [Pelobates cultripes]